jgi:hypothetical protein
VSQLNLRQFSIGPVTPEKIDKLCRAIEYHVNFLAARAGTQYGKQSTDNPNTPTPNASLQLSPPPVAAAQILFVSPNWQVILTSFQDIQPASAAQMSQQSATPGNNHIRTPLAHWVQVSTKQDFSTILQDFGKGYSHVIPYTNANGSLWWRWRSSYDGLNFNGWSPSQTHG